MNKKSAIVIFIGCLLILTNFSVVASAVTVSTSINKNTQKTIEKIDPTSIKNENVISPETYKVVPTIQEKSAPTLEENKVTTTQQSEEDILTKAAPISVGYVVQPGEQVIPGHQQAFLYAANAGGPYSGSVGQAIQFSGSSQYLLFNGATYSWDFDEDGTYEWSSTNNGVTTYTYTKPGKYLATFKVTKSDGKTYIDMAPVDVAINSNDPQPGNHLQPHGGICYYGSVGEPILFDASQSTSTGAPISNYTWYFGDGTVGYGEQVYHTYNEAIPYLVHLEIRDSDGNKRFDVLHADIDCKLSKYADLLATSNQIVQDILSFITDSRIFFYLLDVKVITIYNGYTTETGISDGFDEHYPKVIDVGNNARIQINHISLFKYENVTTSEFTGMSSHTWNSTFSAQILYGISESDNFTVLLQFSFGSWIASKLGIEEPAIQIGYASKAGEEKPTNEFTISHRFRPYILERLLGESSENNQNQEYNQNEESYEYNLNDATTYAGNTQAYPSEQTQTYNDYEINPAPIENIGVQEIKSEQSLQAQAIQQTINGNPLETTDFYPEQEIKFENIDVDHSSLVIAFANNYYSTRTELNLSFSQFVDSTIKSKRFQDVGFNGYEQNNDASLTLTVSRQANGKRATLGLIIDPIQNFVSHVDYAKDPDTGVYTLSFNIDNPPENLVLFTESEDSWGEYKSNYFYLENIPSSLTLDILPKLEDGYISVTKDGSGEFKVGIKNDLKSPSINLYMIHPSLHETRIDWQLLSSPHSIKLSSITTGLSLNAEIKNLTQQDQSIEFHGTLQNDLDVEIEWSFIDGYLAVRKSVTTIDFDVYYAQDDLSLLVNGIYIGGSGDGLTIDFDRFGEQGIIEVDTGRAILLHVYGKKSTASLSTDLSFSTDGHMKLEWDQATFLGFDATHALTFNNLDFSAPEFTVTADNISFASSSSFNLDLTSDQLQLGGTNQIILSNIELAIKRWSGAIGYAKSIGNFNINLEPSIKYYSLTMNQFLELENFNVIFDGTYDQYDTDFEIDDLNLINTGIVWFDFNSPLKFDISTQYQTSTLNLENLHLAIGPQNDRTIDFSISSFNVNGGGLIHSEFNSQHFYVAASVAFNWNIDVTTLSYGSWKINGTYSGSGTMDITEWQPGVNGQVAIGVNTPIHHSLKVIHGQLELELGDMTLNSGSSTIKWKREQSNSNGYFNITSGVSGSLTLCKLTYNNSQNPVEFSIDNIQIQPVKLNVSWQKQSDIKTLHINNNHAIDLGLIKIKWVDKTLTIGNIGLKSGQFNIVYDSANKTITLNNGMNAFGPLCTYEDTYRKLSVDLLNLANDYSKTMTLKWYQDNNNKTIGLYVDTDNSNLVEWIVFESIRYASNPNDITGRRIALGGFQADDFKIMKNTNNKLEVSGHLYIANHLTYSKLVDYPTDQWKDLDLQWNLNLDGVGSIELNSDPGFDEDMKFSTTLAGVDIESTFDLPQHLKFGWDVDFDGQGNITIDTDYEEILGISFEIQKDTAQYQPKWGFYIGAEGLKADDYKLYWDFSGSPGNWNIGSSGEIDSGSIINELYIAWNEQWYNLLLSGQPTQR